MRFDQNKYYEVFLEPLGFGVCYVLQIYSGRLTFTSIILKYKLKDLIVKRQQVSDCFTGMIVLRTWND